jgi:hypothetical protein
MGMDVYKYKIDSITKIDDLCWERPVTESVMNKYISNGLSNDFFTDDYYTLKTDLRQQLIKDHGSFKDWDYSDLSDPTKNYIQFDDGFIYVVKPYDITNTNDQGNRMFNMCAVSHRSAELSYDRKPFRTVSTPSYRDGDTVVLTIDNYGGISDTNEEYIRKTLLDHNDVFFHEDFEIYKTLIPFFNEDVPKAFYQIESGTCVDFSY